MAEGKTCAITGATWCPLSRTKRPLGEESEVRWEVEPIHYVVRLYHPSHPDNYIANAHVRIYGDRGWMSNIIGASFYDVLADNVPALLKACGGIRTLEGFMTKVHARALRMRLRGKAKVEVTHTGMCAGREMPWVVVSAHKDN